MQFSQFFGKISKEMLILIYVQVKSIYLVQYFCYRQNKNHKVSPTPLSTDNFDDSPYLRHPQIPIHFCGKIRYRVSIDYI